MLPNDRDARNALPVWDGCLAYFPDCWAEIAKVSVIGNKQHALGEKLRFAREVSTDHGNKVIRHMLDHATGNVFDTDGTYHLAKAAWRALAALQVAIEAQAPVRSTIEVRSDNPLRDGENHVGLRPHQEGSDAQRFGQEAWISNHWEGY
jgi:hypothetical protein